jgi:ribulose-bisphosphate carboxylase large chain
MALKLGGDRFCVRYHIRGSAAIALAKAKDICLEDTVELPDDLVPDGPIRDSILGRVEDFHSLNKNLHEALISFAVETAGSDLTQFLNVGFGNISIKPGLKLRRFELPDSFLRRFHGPRFGCAGWRNRTGVFHRPLLCTAIKPMGFTAKQCAALAREFALGGIDLIKDDHGLADHPFCRFRDRVRRCAHAVREVNATHGAKAIYIPHISGRETDALERAHFAKEAGAGGLLIAPGLTGYETMRRIADADDIALPIMCHPSFQGSYVVSPSSGVAHGALFGQLARLAGADSTIFPNYGGRFSFTRAQCADIAEAASCEMGRLKPIFPTPGGGMSLERIGDMSRLYGKDAIYLIGAGVYRYKPDIRAGCRRFLEIVEEKAKTGKL